MPSLSALLPNPSGKNRSNVVPPFGTMLDDHPLQEVILSFCPSSFLTTLHLILLLQTHILEKVRVHRVALGGLHRVAALILQRVLIYLKIIRIQVIRIIPIFDIFVRSNDVHILVTVWYLFIRFGTLINNAFRMLRNWICFKVEFLQLKPSIKAKYLDILTKSKLIGNLRPIILAILLNKLNQFLILH